jgi:hypothetical protein
MSTLEVAVDLVVVAVDPANVMSRDRVTNGVAFWQNRFHYRCLVR